MRAKILSLILVLCLLGSVPAVGATSLSDRLEANGEAEPEDPGREQTPDDEGGKCKAVQTHLGGAGECVDDRSYFCAGCQGDGDVNQVFTDGHTLSIVDARLLSMWNDFNDNVYDPVSTVLADDADDGEETLTTQNAADETTVDEEQAPDAFPWSRDHQSVEANGADTAGDDPAQAFVEDDEGDDGPATQAAAAGDVLSGKQMAVLLAAVGAAALSLLVLVRAVPGLMTLFSRFQKGDVLKNGTRAGLHQRVEENPGIHLRALVEGTGLARSTVVHHLAHLERHGLIRSKTVGRSRHFFANGSGYPQDRKEAYAILQNARSRDVLAFLQQEPGADRNRIGAAMGMSWNLTQWYMKRLLDAGLVHGVKRGRSVAFFLTHTARKAALTGPTAAAAAAASA